MLVFLQIRGGNVLREVEVPLGKKVCTVICDAQSIRDCIQVLKTKFEPNTFLGANVYPDDAGYFTKEEYLAHIDEFEKAFEEMIKTENLPEIVEAAQKKKNGMLYKGRIAKQLSCKNTWYDDEYMATWMTPCVQVKANDEATLTFSFKEHKDSPGYW